MKPGKLQRGMPLLWILRGHMVNANVMPQLCEKIKVCLNRRHNLIKLFMASASIQPAVVTPTERVTQYNIYKIKKGISIKILFEGKQFIFLLRQSQAIKNKRMNIVIFGEGYFFFILCEHNPDCTLFFSVFKITLNRNRHFQAQAGVFLFFCLSEAEIFLCLFLNYIEKSISENGLNLGVTYLKVPLTLKKFSPN